MSMAAFIPPLEFDPGDYHFLSPANKETGPTA
jgi:hypothetical protein